MEKDKIFFGESGLTNTSANFIANLAKEFYTRAENELNALTFYTTKVKLIGSSETDLTKQGTETLSGVTETLETIAGLKSLIAWLREAIKAKERLVGEASISTYSDYGIELPEEPKRELPIKADDYIATLNIKQRNRYYYLEAYCSTIGSYIHPEGAFAKARKDLDKIITEPNAIVGSGRDTLLYTRTPSISSEEVEDTFMSLQQTYRSYQAELNSIKHEIETAVNKDATDKNFAFARKMAEYKDAKALCDAELEAKRKEAINIASNLKIVIPDSLKPLFEKVQALGKTNKSV